ncbi:MAG: hypothetical protein HFE39_09685 [Clostridiales bacterium]|nr:hypothetical protein [Clostridiales bacterium]
MTYETIINLDLSGEQYAPPVVAKQGDKDSRYILAHLIAHGAPYKIPAAATAKVSLIKPHGQCVLNDAQITSDDTIKILLTEQMLIDPGTACAEVMLYADEAMLSSAVFDLQIQPGAYNREAIENAPEYQTFVDGVAKIEAATADASTATIAAQTQAAYAKTQGDYAKSQGDSAKTQATNAGAQAEAAGAAASQAESAAQSASDAAAGATTAAQRANDAAQQVEGLDVTQLDTRLTQHVSSNATTTAWGHTRLAGNGGSTSYTMPVSTTAGSVNTLNSTTYLCAGIYMISINASTAGAAGIQGLTSTATRATLTTLPPNNITGSPSSGNALEQILSIPKLQKTYHRYCRVSGTEYGAWARLLDAADLGKAGGAAELDANGMVLAGESPIIESGSNDNGTWIKWADGTMICRKVVNLTATCTTQWGGLYRSEEYDLGQFAVAFIETPTISIALTLGNGTKASGVIPYPGDHIPPTSSNVGGINFCRGNSDTANTNVNIVAYGRWR